MGSQNSIYILTLNLITSCHIISGTSRDIIFLIFVAVTIIAPRYTDLHWTKQMKLEKSQQFYLTVLFFT
jgi:hypothetical protein